jgi:hypothetical protein
LTATVHATPPLSLAALVPTKNSPKARAARAARAAPGAIRRAPPLGVVLDGDQREEHEQEQEPGPLREDQEGEHRQAPRDQTGQEVRASPRDARPERQSESDHAPGA